MAKAVDLPALTSLRFFAAAAVLLHHNAGFFPGYGGVSFFFVLSGFVLAHQWQSRAPSDVGVFYARRIARILPMHLLTLVAAIPLSRGGNILPHLLLVQAWSSDPNVYFGFNSVAWSLSIEAAFYAAFPLLVGRVTMRGVAIWFGVAVAVALTAHGLTEGATRTIFYTNPLARMVEFAAGVALARNPLRIPKPVALALLLATLAVVQAIGALTPLTSGLIFLPMSVGLIAAFADDRSPLTHPLLVRLGQVSFALYMVGQLTQRYVHVLLGESAQTNVLAAVAALPIAYAAHRYVEQPIAAWARGRFATHRNPTATLRRPFG